MKQSFDTMQPTTTAPTTTTAFAINCIDDLLNWFELPIKPPIAHIHLPDAVIGDSLYLEDAKIMGDVNLSDAVIEGELDFRRVEIMGDVNLSDAVIEGELDFRGAKIIGDVNLSDAVIRGELDFVCAEIGGNLDLSGVSCETSYNVYLTDAKIKGSVNLSGLRAFSIGLRNTIVNPASLTPVAPITPATIAFLKSIPLDKLNMDYWQSNANWRKCTSVAEFNECGTAICIRGWAEVLYYIENKHVHPNPHELYHELKHLFHMNNKQALEWVNYYTTEYNLPS